MLREKFLIQFSKEHHDLLILSQLLKSDVPDYKGFPTELNEKVELTKAKFNSQIKPHFIKEQIMFDYLKKNNSEFSNHVNIYEQEHRNIEKMILDLQENNVDANQLNELGILISSHIRNEERKLFQFLQKELTEVNKVEIEKLLNGSSNESEKD